jgi:hypothetical protein
VRDRLGALLPPTELARLPELVRELVRDPARFRAGIARLRAEHVYNVGRSGVAGAEAIAALARELRP